MIQWLITCIWCILMKIPTICYSFQHPHFLLHWVIPCPFSIYLLHLKSSHACYVSSPFHLLDSAPWKREALLALSIPCIGSLGSSVFSLSSPMFAFCHPYVLALHYLRALTWKVLILDHWASQAYVWLRTIASSGKLYPHGREWHWKNTTRDKFII